MAEQHTRTAYDDVPYISGARTDTSPSTMAATARLMGLAAAQPDRCRVLELGCGDGGNLIPLAVAFPGSAFIGLDLAPSAIARAQDAAVACGLTNVRFAQGSFADAGPDEGEFDYIIAHGIYSWVPPAVRAELLATVRDRLAPPGVAFVSYNARPGSHMRHVLRSMMLLHTREITDPAQKVAEARGLLAFLAKAPGDAAAVYRPIIESEVGRALQHTDFLLYHDDLAEVNDPYFLVDFLSEADRFDLQFLAEAALHQMGLDGLPDELAEPLRALGQSDLIAKEQYLDFVTCRSFRQTLLCRANLTLDRTVDLDRIGSLYFASNARRRETGEGGAVEFYHANGSRLRTDNPVAVVVLEHLSASYPRGFRFDQLVELATVAGDDEDLLGEVLYRAAGAGIAEVRACEPAVSYEPGPRPIASPWARLRSESRRAVNLYHETIALDEPLPAILPYLDGGHSAEAIAARLGLEVAAVERAIAELARFGLLTA